MSPDAGRTVLLNQSIRDRLPLMDPQMFPSESSRGFATLAKADCARCHGVDGKGGDPQMRAVPGYTSVDLTRLTERNGGHFPR